MTWTSPRLRRRRNGRSAAREADRATQERIAEGIEGLRRDVANAGRLLGALVAGGGLGNLGDLIKPPK